MPVPPPLQEVPVPVALPAGLDWRSGPPCTLAATAQACSCELQTGGLDLHCLAAASDPGGLGLPESAGGRQPLAAHRRAGSWHAHICWPALAGISRVRPDQPQKVGERPGRPRPASNSGVFRGRSCNNEAELLQLQLVLRNLALFTEKPVADSGKRVPRWRLQPPAEPDRTC